MRVFPVGRSFAGIGDLDVQGSLSGGLRGKTEKSKHLLWKLKDECRMAVINRFSLVARTTNDDYGKNGFYQPKKNPTIPLGPLRSFYSPTKTGLPSPKLTHLLNYLRAYANPSGKYLKFNHESYLQVRHYDTGNGTPAECLLLIHWYRVEYSEIQALIYAFLT